MRTYGRIVQTFVFLSFAAGVVIGLVLTGRSAFRGYAHTAPWREVIEPLSFTAIAGAGLMMFLLIRKLLRPIIVEQRERYW